MSLTQSNYCYASLSVELSQKIEKSLVRAWRERERGLYNCPDKAGPGKREREGRRERGEWVAFLFAVCV